MHLRNFYVPSSYCCFPTNTTISIKSVTDFLTLLRSKGRLNKGSFQNVFHHILLSVCSTSVVFRLPVWNKIMYSAKDHLENCNANRLATLSMSDFQDLLTANTVTGQPTKDSCRPKSMFWSHSLHICIVIGQFYCQLLIKLILLPTLETEVLTTESSFKHVSACRCQFKKNLIG